MAEWTKLSDGTWGVKMPAGRGRPGQTVTVTRANGTESKATLGTLVVVSRWGRVFALAGKKAPAARRRPRARRRPVAPVARPAPVAVPTSYVDDVAALPSWDDMVATPEVVDASVARFRLLDLSDDVAPVAPVADDGPGRLLQID